nr:oxidoreductase-like domain-containing protein [Burkholderia vietnamiensis]
MRAAGHRLILRVRHQPTEAVTKPDAADAPADDPRPISPEQPELEDCCNSGCSPCVFDLYDEALARYRAELAEWEARHAPPKPQS